jgi:hypothetical protein
MRRFGFGFVVGILFLFIGASMALDTVFAMHVPIVTLAIALFLVAVGAKVLLGSGTRRQPGPSSGEAWLADRRFAPDGPLTRDERYDVVFGRGFVDLSHVPAPTDDVTVQIDAVFGTAVVKMNPAVPYEVIGSAAFGEVKMPDRSAAAFGNVAYRSKPEQPHLHVKVNAVFGACQVVEGA